MKYFVLSFMLLTLSLTSARSQVSNGAASTSDTISQELIRLEKQKDQAYEQGDKAALDRIYADDYQGIAANGAIISRKTVLEFFPRPNVFQSHRSEDVVVRVFGEVAVVTGIQKRKFYKDIKPGGEDTLRYTNVYVKRNGIWQIVAAQFSPLKK